MQVILYFIPQIRKKGYKLRYALADSTRITIELNKNEQQSQTPVKR